MTAVTTIQGNTDKTTRQVAEMFTASYWAEPRKLVNWTPANTVESEATFGVKNGTATYRIYFDDRWIIERSDNLT